MNNFMKVSNLSLFAFWTLGRRLVLQTITYILLTSDNHVHNKDGIGIILNDLIILENARLLCMILTWNWKFDFKINTFELNLHLSMNQTENYCMLKIFKWRSFDALVHLSKVSCLKIAEYMMVLIEEQYILWVFDVYERWRGGLPLRTLLKYNLQERWCGDFTSRTELHLVAVQYLQDLRINQARLIGSHDDMPNKCQSEDNWQAFWRLFIHWHS